LGYTDAHSSGRIVDLKSAWGDIAHAIIVNVPARLVYDGEENNSMEVPICCAVTNRLQDDTALVSVEDMKILQEAYTNQIPRVQLITGTHVQYTDPSYHKEQIVRRVEERVMYRSGQTIGIPLFNPKDLPDLRKTDRETEE
jgi:hypothetical protein